MKRHPQTMKIEPGRVGGVPITCVCRTTIESESRDATHHYDRIGGLRPPGRTLPTLRLYHDANQEYFLGNIEFLISKHEFIRLLVH